MPSKRRTNTNNECRSVQQHFRYNVRAKLANLRAALSECLLFFLCLHYGWWAEGTEHKEDVILTQCSLSVSKADHVASDPQIWTLQLILHSKLLITLASPWDDDEESGREVVCDDVEWYLSGEHHLEPRHRVVHPQRHVVGVLYSIIDESLDVRV